MFICYRCQKQFPFKSRLESHLARKTPCDKYDGPDLVCTTCNKAFSTQGNLTRHLKTGCHPEKATAPNPKQCPHCKRIFARNGICKAHVERGCPSLTAAAGAGFKKKEEELQKRIHELEVKEWKEKKRIEGARKEKRAEFDDCRKYFIEEQVRRETEMAKVRSRLEAELAAERQSKAEKEAEVLRLEKEKLYLEATHRYDLREIDRLTALVGTSGSTTAETGGMAAAAGRDAHVTKQEIHLNIYGGENFDLLQKPTFITNIVRRLHLELASG